VEGGARGRAGRDGGGVEAEGRSCAGGEPPMTSPLPLDEATEWLEADGLGGFASGTTSGLRTRRYHALLQVATTPPTGRMVLVNGFDAWVAHEGATDATSGSEFLRRQRYVPGLVAPAEGAVRESFIAEPAPTWPGRLKDGTRIEQELFVPSGQPIVALRWRATGGSGPIPFYVRPFLSGRDSHALQHENPVFRFAGDRRQERVTWRPY